MDRYSLIALLSAAALTMCDAASAQAPDLSPKAATAATTAANEKLLSELPFSNRQDFEDARRGFVATIAGRHPVPRMPFYKPAAQRSPAR